MEEFYLNNLGDLSDDQHPFEEQVLRNVLAQREAKPKNTKEAYYPKQKMFIVSVYVETLCRSLPAIETAVHITAC